MLGIIADGGIKPPTSVTFLAFGFADLDDQTLDFFSLVCRLVFQVIHQPGRGYDKDIIQVLGQIFNLGFQLRIRQLDIQSFIQGMADAFIDPGLFKGLGHFPPQNQDIVPFV